MRSTRTIVLFCTVFLALGNAQAQESSSVDTVRVGVGAGGDYFWQSNGQRSPGQGRNIGEVYGMALMSIGQRLTFDIGVGISANVVDPHPLYVIGRLGLLYGEKGLRAGGLAWVEHSVSNTTFTQDRLIVGPAAQLGILGGLRLEATAGYLHNFVWQGQPAQDGFGLFVMLAYISGN